MSKHTPGPWTASPVSSIIGSLIAAGFREGGQSYNVAAVMPQVDKEECEANARLIAAAPELLEELKRLKQDFNGMLHAFESSVRAAIGNTNFSVLQERVKAAEAAIAKAESGQ